MTMKNHEYTEWGLNQANFSTASRFVHSRTLSVRVLHVCGNCGISPATTVVAGLAFRCQPCANHLVSLWAEMRSELDTATAP